LFFICDPQAPLNLEEVNRVSKILEKVEHGTPSGIDNFVSTYGGLILYNNSKQPQFEKIEN
jgi:mevalonate kinase